MRLSIFAPLKTYQLRRARPLNLFSDLAQTEALGFAVVAHDATNVLNRSLVA